MNIIWTLIFIHLSHGQPVQIDIEGAAGNFPDCRAAVKIYEAEKRIVEPDKNGYYTCLGVKK